MQIRNKKINYIAIVILFFCLFVTMGARADSQIEDKVNFKKEFFIGLTEIYYGQNYINSNLKDIDEFDRYQKKVNIGRVNFYLKGKIKGKYLLTVWLDTGEKSIDEIFKSLDQRKNLTPFEKIDPEKYYLIYGDNSSNVNDINTSGNLYVSIKSDDFKLLFGDFKTKFNKNDLINFSKNLYGLNISYNNKLAINSFLHKNFNLYLQDKLELTGGKIYYLREDNIAAGSEMITFEIKDMQTDRIFYSKKLIPGKDYDINYLQGRVILKVRLKRLKEKGLIESDSEQKKYYLLANYQLNDNNQKNELTSYGIEGSYQLTKKFEVGVTKIKEANNEGDFYNILGYNLQYISDKDTILTLNWACSKNILYAGYFSDDGGISYDKKEDLINNNAEVWDIELKKDITDNIILNTYYTNKEKGFSSVSNNLDNDIKAYGISLKGLINETEAVFSFEKNIKGDNTTDITAFNLLKKYNSQLELEIGLENNYQKENKAKSLIGAVGFDYQLDENKNFYGSQQLTIFDNENNKNNITKVGGKFKRDRWDIDLEGKFGTRNSLKFNTGYQLNQKSEIYSSVEQKFDNENLTTISIGTSSRLNDKTSIYSEYRTDNDENKKESIVGVDYKLLKGLVFNLDFTNSNIKKETDKFNRKIISLNSTYNKDNIQASGQMEYRKDNGNNDLKQLILNSKVKWQYNKEFTLLSKIEYLQEKQIEENTYYKGTVGFSYRPINNDRLNLLGKYFYMNRENEIEDIEDLKLYPVEKTQVLSLDLVYDLSNRWQITEKIAYKDNTIKMNLPSDDWKSSRTYLWINRLNYNLRDDIEIFGEYRVLNNNLAGDSKNGFLLGGYKSFADNIKMGIGYNFTTFNDNLTNLNYESKGWFLNFIKVW